MSRWRKGHVAVITGSSSGIGLAIADSLADKGLDLVLAARGEERLREAANTIVERYGVDVLTVPTDVGDLDACRHLIDATRERFGRLDVLVNNAAAHSRGPFASNTTDDLARMVDVNLRGPLALCHLALPLLHESPAGQIVNVASLAGCIPLPGAVTYSSTKFGLRALSRALAEELRETTVRVSCVSPGPVATPFILDDLDSVSDLTLAQPMRSADAVAGLVVACTNDGKVERTDPPISAFLATFGYLFPRVARLLRPRMEARGRKRREEIRRERETG